VDENMPKQEKEEYVQKAKMSGITFEELSDILKMLYEE
jgi:DNA-binding transcriptional regulator YhcF (GntR family)